MKLMVSPTSPYARKVVVVADEGGLKDKIELVRVNTKDPNNPISTVNPLGKIPALERDDGTCLYDSPVIAEYLVSLSDVDLMGGDRWYTLRLQALADGMMDAAYIRATEAKAPAEDFRDAFHKKLKGKIACALDALESEADGFGDEVTVGLIAVGCALGYLDFRHASDQWRNDRPALADWYDGFSARPSMMATVPEDPQS